MTLKRWTPAEKATLQELYRVHAAPEIARIMGKDVGAVYSAIARNKFTKGDDFFMSNQVIALCKSSPGVTCAEISHRLNKDYDNVGTAIRRMLKTGEIFRVGKGKNFRYYADQQAADVAQAQALEADAKHREAMRRKKQEARNLARRLQREKEAKAFKRNEERKAKRLQAQQVVVEVRKAKPVEQPMTPANVIWPETVKVTTIPTPPSRFAFEPPPGWRGQITHDWMDQRLSKATNNARN
jgi:hypothetical protein